VANYINTQGSPPLEGNYFVPFGKSGDMGDNITTQIIHRQNAMLKSTNQRFLANLNDINAVIEMETPATANFGHNGMFTLLKVFFPTRMTPESRFPAVLRRHKQAAHIISSSMIKIMKPWTKS
jgi:hypothetical protein